MKYVKYIHLLIFIICKKEVKINYKKLKSYTVKYMSYQIFHRILS